MNQELVKGKIYRLDSYFAGTDAMISLWKGPDSRMIIGTLRKNSLVIWLSSVVRNGVELHQVIVGDLVGWCCGILRDPPREMGTP